MNSRNRNRQAPELKLFNTLTRREETVEAFENDHLRMYSCGPTVYSYAHIGNFRSFLTADLILRTARAAGREITYVTNITDVGHLTEDDFADAAGEDKLARALRSEEGGRFANIWDLADHYSAALREDWRNLNLIEPHVWPRATQHIREQILAIKQLVESGYAYETSKGVYFSVEKFPPYGKLSGNLTPDQLAEQSGRDLIRDPEKRDPRDFALWKKDEKHLMQWYSPWGWGFPGWHIECSVMAMEYLGSTFDIHAGGEDLIFPHHECEIAQSECLTGEKFARCWVHTRFLQVEGEKMSKSKGNYLTVRELTSTPEHGGRGVDPLALRYALISGHYRKPLNFTFENLTASAKNIVRYREVGELVCRSIERGSDGSDTLGENLRAVYNRTVAAMADDLNTPEALAASYDGTRMILSNAPLNRASAESAREWLEKTNALLGIVKHERRSGEHTPETSDTLEERVEELVAQRNRARQDRDFSRADAIREELDEMGIEVMDSPDGTTWRKKVSIPAG